MSASAFSPDGAGALIALTALTAFERDAAGRVAGYVRRYPAGRGCREPDRLLAMGG